MNGQGKKVPTTAFTLDQAWSAMAMWAMLASPLMIGADVRAMAPEYREVWLSEELIRVSRACLRAYALLRPLHADAADGISTARCRNVTHYSSHCLSSVLHLPRV